MPVTGSGKGLEPYDSKPLSGHIHAGWHASNLALHVYLLPFQTYGCSPEETVPGLPTSATAGIMDLTSTQQQLQVLECHIMDPRRAYLHAN